MRRTVGLKRIPVTDKPLSQGGIPTLLTPEDFKEKFGCEYTEDIVFSAETIARFGQRWQLQARKQPKDFYRHNLEEKIRERQANPLKSLVIYFIDEQVGFGVQAVHDIPAGTVLCFYAGDGVYKPNVSVKGAEHDSCLWRSGGGDGVDVSAKDKRGLAGFMQHLPLDFETEKAFLKEKYEDVCERMAIINCHPELEESDNFIQDATKIHFGNDADELDDFEFRGSAKASVATANVMLEVVYLDGRPMNVMVATRDIKKWEPVGFSYGKAHWQVLGENPLLFNRDGTLLAKDAYKRLTVNMTFQQRGSNSVDMGLVQAPFNPTGHSVFNVGGSHFQSIYMVRHVMAAANAKGANNYGPLNLSSFAMALLSVLMAKVDKQITVSMYWKNPTLPITDKNYGIVDVVCHARSKIAFDSMISFFKAHKSPISVEAIGATKEVIIRGTNETNRLDELHQFVTLS